MARCLIIGCGCRGRLLARALRGRGHVVRGTTRDPARCAAIRSAGVEAIVADPDRVATLTGALEHVTVACVLLGSAAGPAPRLEQLHGPRLEALLAHMLDTTVRGIVYEARGAVDAAVLAAGGELVRAFCERARAGCGLLQADPLAPGPWLAAALSAVDLALSPR